MTAPGRNRCSTGGGTPAGFGRRRWRGAAAISDRAAAPLANVSAEAVSRRAPHAGQNALPRASSIEQEGHVVTAFRRPCTTRGAIIREGCRAAGDAQLSVAASTDLPPPPRGWRSLHTVAGALARSRWSAFETIADRARQLGDKFTLGQVMDEINAAGMIPVSLVYWEVTGDDRMVREFQGGRPLPPR
jgi:hypothetical protein